MNAISYACLGHLYLILYCNVSFIVNVEAKSDLPVDQYEKFKCWQNTRRCNRCKDMSK
jgi:hypothetical protein